MGVRELWIRGATLPQQIYRLVEVGQQEVGVAHPIIGIKYVLHTWPEPHRFFEVRKRRLRLAEEHQGDAELQHGGRVIAVDSNRLFELDFRFDQSVLQPPQPPHLEQRSQMVAIARERLDQHLLGARHVLARFAPAERQILAQYRRNADASTD